MTTSAIFSALDVGNFLGLVVRPMSFFAPVVRADTFGMEPSGVLSDAMMLSAFGWFRSLGVSEEGQ